MNTLLEKILSTGNDNDTYVILFKWIDKLNESPFDRMEYCCPSRFAVIDDIQEVLFLRKFNLHDVIEDVIFEEEIIKSIEKTKDQMVIPDWKYSEEKIEKEKSLSVEEMFDKKIVPVTCYVLVVSHVETKGNQ